MNSTFISVALKNISSPVISTGAKRNGEILFPRKQCLREDLFTKGECFRFAQVSTPLRSARHDELIKLLNY